MFMLPTEESYQEKINAFTPQQWAPLLELIPLIQQEKEFGAVFCKNEHTMPYWKNSEVVRRFSDIAYRMPIVINFEWMRWPKGKEIKQNENFDFDSIDIPTKCKYITLLLRADRFCDGFLSQAFESGCVLKILVSIKKQLKG